MDLSNLSVEDLITLREYMKLAEEAQQEATLLAKHYANAFGLGTSQINVYNYSQFGEYYANADLRIDGKWILSDNWGGDNHWVIDVTPDGIFNLYREAFNQENNRLYTMKDPKTVASNFRRFIQQVKQQEENPNV